MSITQSTQTSMEKVTCAVSVVTSPPTRSTPPPASIWMQMAISPPQISAEPRNSRRPATCSAVVGDADLDLDHVEHDDVRHDREADDDLGAEAELHAQRDAGLAVGGDAERDLPDGVDARHRQREALHLQAAVELDVGAARGHELLEVGRDREDLVEVKADLQAGLELQRRVRD